MLEQFASNLFDRTAAVDGDVAAVLGIAFALLRFVLVRAGGLAVRAATAAYRAVAKWREPDELAVAVLKALEGECVAEGPDVVHGDECLVLFERQKDGDVGMVVVLAGARVEHLLSPQDHARVVARARAVLGRLTAAEAAREKQRILARVRSAPILPDYEG